MKFLNKVQSKHEKIISTSLTNKEMMFEVLNYAEDIEEATKEIRFQVTQARRDPDESAQDLLNAVKANIYKIERIINKINKDVLLK